MQLHVGILGDSPGWRQVLLQEGVPFSHVQEEIPGELFSAVVIGDSVDERDAESVRAYLKQGGSVLCSGRIFAQLAGTHHADVAVRYLLPEPESDFEGIGLIDLQQRCRVPLNANTLKNERGATTLFSGEFLGGHIIALPFDVDAVMLDLRTSRKSFYSPARRLPFERVSTLSRGSIRLLLSRSLEILHHARSLPYVHLWYFPKGSESIFLLRVDTDRGNETEIRELYTIARNHRVPMTWFLDAKSHEHSMAQFKNMEHQEIGLHCYEHQVYPDYDRNAENIDKAVRILNDSGFQPKGYAAPMGKWNEQLARSVKQRGFEYSSEFSFDYDNLPSSPIFRDNFVSVQQVPVHPVSIGSLKRQGYNDARMIQYFEFVLRQKLALGLPLAFCHHPKDRHHSVLEHVFNYVAGRNIPMMSFRQYADWWSARQGLNLRLTCEGNRLKSSGRPSDEDFFLHLTKGDGSEAHVPLRNDIHLDQIAWEQKQKPFPLPADYTRSRRFNYRIPLTQAVDLLSQRFAPS